MIVLLGSGTVFLFGSPHVRRGIAHSTVTSDALAQSALAATLADLQQEITAGSNSTTVGATTLYTPKVPTDAVPALVGSTGAGGLANLVKRSASGLPFYPPANRDSSASNRAAGVSTSASSLNGFSVLPPRWNRPLLLPKANGASDTDLTPVGTGANAFVVPDWVLMASDGSNPTTWNANLQTSGTNPVIGRYAYTIYDEGGLLDMTVAGYPGGTDARQIGYKDSLASADLTQVGLTQAQIDAVINARTANPFAGRQDLISLMTGTIATDAASRAALQNTLPYLGTFSRGLSQPSYAPVSRADPVNPRPLIQPSGSLSSTTTGNGGNNVGDNYTTAAAQDVFSPVLLTLRAEAAFTRNDGTTAAVAGEPLVKNRFALQRLAWLTYLGPSANRSTSDTDMQQLIVNYGMTAAYLAQGTAANIQRYFGLTWDATNHVWKYNAHNGSGSGAIMKLPDIADQKTREPDFFELLKASVDVGALGKTGTNGPNAQSGDTNGIAPLNFDFRRDVSVDAAIIQLGANIMDQFDVDGYPTRIVFDDGSGRPLREFRGVENLPYIYRIRMGTLVARESIPPSQAIPTGPGSFQSPYLHSGSQSGYTANPLKDTGAGVLKSVPDIWNPHDENSSMGNPRPGSSGLIRLVANSATPDTIYTNTSETGYSTFMCGTYVGTDAAHGNYRGASYTAAVAPDTTAAPPIPYFTRIANPTGTAYTSSQIMSGSNGGFNYPHAINATNASYLTFKVPDSKLYREPTLLGQADLYGPSALSMAVDFSNLDILMLRTTSGASAYTAGSGLLSVTSNPLQMPTAPTGSSRYIGITLGTYPLRWVGPRWSGSNAGTLWNYTAWSMSDVGFPAYSITYSLQYQDPLNSNTWVSYDEKYVDSDVSFLNPQTGQIVQPKLGNYSFADPRTARFGSATENGIADTAHYRVPLASNTSTWLDYSSKLLSVVTERPDLSSGFGSNYRGNYYSTPDWGYYAAPGIHSQNIDIGSAVNAIFFQTGLLSQNNPYFPSDGLRYVGDSSSVGTRDANFWSDPDGVVRRAMGAYVATNNTTGQPLATATILTNGVGTPRAQSQSRPIILNRPFRSVAELGGVFSGNPWKNIDFSTPESAYSELLDVFCVSEADASASLTPGRVNLNTRQPLVLQSVLAGAYTDEERSFAASPVWSTTPLTAADAQSIAGLLVTRTSQSPLSGVNAGNGPQPLTNVGDLVGRWNGTQTITGSFTPALGSVHNVDGSRSYDGFSGDLGTLASLTSLSPDALKIPRLRESAVRALSNVGNTRVWNLMIDLIAQTGEYTTGSSSLDQFTVEGSQRYWLHVAIDRLTGAVLDQSMEPVNEVSPTDVTLTSTAVPENQAAGTAVGTLGAVDSNAASTFGFALVNGAGSADNASFAISGNVLQTNATLRYLDKSSYNIRVREIDQDGMSLEKTFTISVLPSPYTQWKIAKFGNDANNSTIAGDLADPDYDGLVNLLEYTLGRSPLVAHVPVVSLQRSGNTAQFNYTRLSAATDVTAHVYWNSDLTNPNGWSTTGVTETMLSDDGNVQRWQATLSLSPGQNAFLRLQVTLP